MDMPDEVDRDEQILVLREAALSFAGIALLLGLEDAHTANAGFNRALRCRPKAQQEWLRSREMTRLSAVASAPSVSATISAWRRSSDDCVE